MFKDILGSANTKSERVIKMKGKITVKQTHKIAKFNKFKDRIKTKLGSNWQSMLVMLAAFLTTVFILVLCVLFR